MYWQSHRKLILGICPCGILTIAVCLFDTLPLTRVYNPLLGPYGRIIWEAASVCHYRLCTCIFHDIILKLPRFPTHPTISNVVLLPQRIVLLALRR